MAESVIVTGRNLTIEQTGEADPKRKRPPTYQPTTGEHRTLADLPDINPYNEQINRIGRAQR